MIDKGGCRGICKDPHPPFLATYANPFHPSVSNTKNHQSAKGGKHQQAFSFASVGSTADSFID